MRPLFRGLKQACEAAVLTAVLALSGTAQSKAPRATPTAYSYVHHPVSTDIPTAQSEFDRGLTLIFAYQSDEAERAFRQAARLDPSMAMAWWGIGLALGPDINVPPDRAKTSSAADALSRAQQLAERRATESERAYIAALATRYSSDATPDFDRLATAYRDAMRAVVQKYPDDPDAAALYAEAIMDLRPWRLWNWDGTPAPGTEELVQVIERGLAKHPDHLGLLHFYIHAVEASNDPSRALPAARRLASLPMEPAASHLVHMPAHIYMRTGDWESAVEANNHAVHHALDYRLSLNPKQHRACGHCVDFLTYAYMMQGNQAQARKSAQDFQEMSQDPSNAIAVLVRFRLWQDVLTFPDPGPDLKVFSHNAHAVRGLWHFSRGLAFAATQHPDKARDELDAVRGESAMLPIPVKTAGHLDVEHAQESLSEETDIADMQIAVAILGSRIAEANQQMSEAVQLLRTAVKLQDEMPYNEPPGWFYPVRESLGALLLRAGKPAEAEAVFREDLRRSLNNPRSELGLTAALGAQGRSQESQAARARFETAWKYSDVKITAEEL